MYGELLKAASDLRETSKSIFDPQTSTIEPLLGGIEIITQISAGRNVSPTGGKLECALEGMAGYPNYASKEDCLATYTKDGLYTSTRLIDLACDKGTTNSNSVCFAVIYVHSLGKTIRQASDNIVTTKQVLANSQVIRDSVAYWGPKLEVLAAKGKKWVAEKFGE